MGCLMVDQELRYLKRIAASLDRIEKLLKVRGVEPVGVRMRDDESFADGGGVGDGQ